MTDIYRAMNDQHPITPPPDLVEQWEAETAHTTKDEMWHVAVQAARWGADQELEACCDWLERNYNYPRADHPLRTARRPKLPTLKEQALIALHAVATGANDTREQHQDLDTIRRALEALPND
jgi:hypothetical protein